MGDNWAENPQPSLSQSKMGIESSDCLIDREQTNGQTNTMVKALI